MKLSFLRTDILSTTGILLKLTKNLVIIISSLWTRCSVKYIYIYIYIWTLALIHPAKIHKLPPNCKIDDFPLTPTKSKTGTAKRKTQLKFYHL